MEDFIAQIRANDQKATTKLYNEYKPLVEETLYKMFRNQDIVDDLVSEVFMKIFNRIETYNNVTPLAVWIRAVATNAGIDYIRSSVHKFYMNSESMDDMSQYFQIADDSLNKEESIIAEEASKIFEKRKSRMHSGFQEIVRLHLHGKTYKEISEITGVSMGTVKSRIHRAKKMLKNRTTNN